jgi:hypothetical protein
MQDALVEYVKHVIKAKDLLETVQTWPVTSDEMIVYRGHRDTYNDRGNKIYDTELFSSTSDIQVAYDEFSSEECCIFKIHVQPKIHYLNVNAKIGTDHRHAHEKEILVEGGGVFFQDIGKKNTGFKKVGPYKGKTVFETYYFPKEAPKIRRRFSQLLKRLAEGEAELYNRNELLTAVKGTLLEGEEFNKGSVGGGRRRRRRRTRRLSRRKKPIT